MKIKKILKNKYIEPIYNFFKIVLSITIKLAMLFALIYFLKWIGVKGMLGIMLGVGVATYLIFAKGEIIQMMADLLGVRYDTDDYRKQKGEYNVKYEKRK